MKSRIVTSAFLAASLAAIGIGAYAQKSSTDQTQQDKSTQSQTAPGMMGGGMMGQGGMMGMMGMMGQMMTHHQQMSALMSRLMQSMTAIQSEKDPEVLKSKLTEHQKLLEEMRSQMMGQGNQMNMMSGQMKQYCTGSGATDKPGTK